MKNNQFIKFKIFIVTLSMVSFLLPGVGLAAAPEAEVKAVSQLPGEGLAQIATGSVLDTLKACLGRIPSTASAGQLMLAEQTCQKAEAERNGANLTF